MVALGITGGVGTGKSFLTEKLASLLNAEVYDADRCAKELLAANREVQTAIRDVFGTEALSEDGTPDRAKLREMVFIDAEKRKTLEQILHPRIRKAWLERLEQSRAANSHGWWLAEIPLLYETEAESLFDGVIVVACDAQTQRKRLVENRGLTPEIAQRIIRSQLPLQAKIDRADWMIWNAGSVANLNAQAELCASHLKLRYA